MAKRTAIGAVALSLGVALAGLAAGCASDEGEQTTQGTETTESPVAPPDGIAESPVTVDQATGGLSDAHKQALQSCTICHDISNAKKTMVGPPLWGVYGSKPSITGVPFETWDEASLDKWITDPQAIKPGTAMNFKVADAAQRKQVIEALKALK